MKRGNRLVSPWLCVKYPGKSQSKHFRTLCVTVAPNEGDEDALRYLFNWLFLSPTYRVCNWGGVESCV